MTRQPSVADHLQAFGEIPDWVLTLGEAIYETTRCSAAIAASRARDLSRQVDIGKGLEALLRGWQRLEKASFSDLSPMQQETIRLVVRQLLESLNVQVNESTEADPERKELSA
jgi:hypothetical protein